MFTQISVAFLRPESHYRRPQGKTKSSSNSSILRPNTENPETTRPNGENQDKSFVQQQSGFSKAMDTRPMGPKMRLGSEDATFTANAPRSTRLESSQTVEHNNQRSPRPLEHLESEMSSLTTRVEKQNENAERSQGKRRSWRVTVTKAKQWACSVLKSSATFHSGISTAPGDISGCSSGTTAGILGSETVEGNLGSCNRPPLTMTHAKAAKAASDAFKKPEISAKKRSKSVQGPKPKTSKTPTDLILFNLSQRQCYHLRCTWHRIRGNGGLKFAERIFESLFEADPSIKDIFYKAAFLAAFENSLGDSQPSKRLSICKRQSVSSSITTCRDHAWITLRLLDYLILGWEDGDGWRSNESIASKLRQFGAKHAFLEKSAGMRADLWEKFGEAAVDIVRRYECIRANTDASRAWRLLLAGITDQVREGYEKELRKR